MRGPLHVLSAALAGVSPDEHELTAALRRLSGTPEEAEGVSRVERARGAAPVSALCWAASTLDARGEPERALALLSGVHDPLASLVRADALASKGDLAAALAAVEDAMVRRFDLPGAAERRERWRRAMGRDVPPQRDAAPTLLGAAPTGPLVLVAEAGRGGAATVYEAWDTVLGRRVALKAYHGGPRDRDQALHEGRAAAACRGPGVVAVLDANPTHGTLVLAWVAGGSLAAAVQRRDPEWFARPERWVVPLARTLARLHGSRFVHADLKPSNVLLHPRDGAVLTDFGLCGRTGERRPAGSPGWARPERLRGEPLSPVDDLHALARLLEVAAPDEARWRRLALAVREGALDAAGLAADVGSRP